MKNAVVFRFSPAVTKGLKYEKKPERFRDFFTVKNESVSPFGRFHRPKWQNSFTILQQIPTVS